jgi:hypothetical protein
MFDPDASEQGLGKAMTYGMRYFLYKSLLVATASDDPDMHQQKILSRKPKPTLSQDQLNGIMKLIGPHEELFKLIVDHYKVGDLSAIAADQYQTILNVINSRLQNAKN